MSKVIIINAKCYFNSSFKIVKKSYEIKGKNPIVETFKELD